MNFFPQAGQQQAGRPERARVLPRQPEVAQRLHQQPPGFQSFLICSHY